MGIAYHPNKQNNTNKMVSGVLLQLDVIGIDEGQFMQGLKGFCEVAADRDGKAVVIAGLDGDFQR